MSQRKKQKHHKYPANKPNQVEVLEKSTGAQTLLTLVKSNILLLLLFIIGGFLLYGRVLNGTFLTADDISTIVEDPLSKDLVASVQTANLINIYEAVAYQLFNFTSFGFHLFSTLMHVLNAFLVFLLVSRLYNQKFGLFVSAIFLVHPVNSETVSWISAFVYLLLGTINLIIFLTFVEFKKTQNKKYSLLSVVVFAASLMFIKTPWLLTIPLSLMVIDAIYFYDRDKSLKENLIQKFNMHFFYLVCAGFYFVVELVNKYAVRISDLQTYHYLDPTKSEPLLNRYSYSITKALELLMFPINLTIFHEGELITTVRLHIMIGLSVLLILLLLIFFFKKNFRTSGLILLIYISILPSFSPVIVAWFIAERYLYIPSMFFGILLVSSLLYVEKRFELKNFASSCILVVVMLFSIKTFTRAENWQNDKQLWTATLQTSPLSYRVYNNLGDVYFKEQNYALAIQNFEIAYKLKPDYADAVHNIGHTYMQMGNYEEAKKYLVMSFQMNPRLQVSLFKLGIIEVQQRNFLEGKNYFEKTLQIDPNFVQAKTALAQLEKFMQNNNIEN